MTAEDMKASDLDRRNAQILSLAAENRALREALKTIADGKEVQCGDHTEMVDIDDPAELARAALVATKPKT